MVTRSLSTLRLAIRELLGIYESSRQPRLEEMPAQCYKTSLFASLSHHHRKNWVEMFLLKLLQLTEVYFEQHPLLFGPSAHPATHEHTSVPPLSLQRAGSYTNSKTPPQARERLARSERKEVEGRGHLKHLWD